MMDCMRKNREERRTEIAAAALKIVGEYGVAGATMARIAEEVGISGPALYKHFSGRAEILEAAMDLLLVRVVSWLDSSKNPDALERLRELGVRARLHHRRGLRGRGRAAVRVRGGRAALATLRATGPEAAGRAAAGLSASSRKARLRAPSARTSTCR